jgi:hypothetical protein
MRVRTFGLAGLAAALMMAAPGRSDAQTGQAWLHVRVDEPSKQGKVTVNLPVSVVSAALQAAPEKWIADGHIRMGHFGHGKRDLSVADLRRAWSELKKTGDSEFVTVEEEDQKVRIARAGNLVLVHVDKPSGRESVRVEVPVEVVDALLSGQGEELNLRAAFAELQNRRGDIVRVKDDSSTVRIWIDERN